MPRTIRTVPRLVVVLVVLASLGYAVGLHCIGMATEMVMGHGATSTGALVACESPLAMEQCAAPADAYAGTANDSSDFHGLGDVLAACLAFLIAVVAAVATLRPGRLRGAGHASQPARVAELCPGRPRPPSLAELCVLRT